MILIIRTSSIERSSWLCSRRRIPISSSLSTPVTTTSITTAMSRSNILQ
ncbi:hypothetical protein BVRB_012480 isoform B [Beta vulgaris subsp. vulgaris]|uniref:Uncharacterized protein n=1 Tax=Beta vulgaris subsp. vulgaris TaxID=3555 RepID=A0A0J8DW90_BETVV|nr:hypothetical protein BVRB_012480 isoform B [Beta vulgaris subsp. vulgaris]